MPEEVPELYQLIAVSGSDRETFLQGQLTQDVAALQPEAAMLAAWCNAKGRVIVVLRLVSMPDAIGLAVPTGMTDAVLKRLAMYRLRADVQFDVVDEWSAIAGDPNDCDGASVSRSLVFAGEPPLAEYFGPLASLADIAQTVDRDNWRAALVAAGVASIDMTTTEQFTPHMLNLDRLGAISFSKGCYTGQEIVARTENLGKSRRRLMRYRAKESGIAPGTKLSVDGQDVGSVVVSAGPELLAVTPLEYHEISLELADHGPAEPLGLPYSLEN